MPAVRGEPFHPVEFAQMRVTEAWLKYGDALSWGRGQTLAILDDGCDLSVPEWNESLPWGAPKVAAGWNSVDGNDDPSLVPPGYHGTSTGYPSSLCFRGRLGVAFHDQVIHVRGVTVVHLPGIRTEADSVARGLQWIIDHREAYGITAVNLSPVDDKSHAAPVATAVDAKLAALRELGVWVSAPCGNAGFTDGVCWPACQPGTFAVGAAKPGEDAAHLNRSARTDILSPAAATTSSNAHMAGCAMVLREAILLRGSRWKADGPTLPDAMMAIFKATGAPVRDAETGLTFPRVDLLAALDRVLSA